MKPSELEPPAAEAETIRCRLCRRPYRQITASHLRWKHATDCEAYAERFPGTPFMAPQTRRHLSDSIISLWERLGRHWTRDRVERTLAELRSKGQPLHPRALTARRPDLYGAMVRLYGSWERACEAAGIPPESVRRRRNWSDRELIAVLREAAARGDLRYGAVFRKGRSGLVQACAKRWGTWRAALLAAGLRPLRPPPTRWTRREVAIRIRARFAAGEPLLASHVHYHAPALKRAAEGIFRKPWRDIVRGLGLPYAGRRRWSPASVVREIREIRAGGRSLRCESVRRESRALALAAVRHFGGWERALRAAGIDPRGLRPRHWTREQLSRLFRRLQRSGNVSRRSLRAVRKPGYVQPTASIPRYWPSLSAALRNPGHR